MRRTGFTLIELMISTALTLTILGSMLFALGQGLRAWKQAARESDGLAIESLVADRIVRDIRSASEILTGSSSTEAKLLINSEMVSYGLVAGKVRRKVGSYTAFLTSAGEINRLSFSYPAAEAIEVTLGSLSFRAGLRN